MQTICERGVIEDISPIRTSCFSTKGGKYFTLLIFPILPILIIDYFAIGTNSKSIKNL